MTDRPPSKSNSTSTQKQQGKSEDKNEAPIISEEELRHHNHRSPEPWFAINGDVFDGTKYLRDHPGGAQSIKSAAGLDVTEEFMAIRKSYAQDAGPAH